MPKCLFSNWFAWSHTTLFSTQHALDSIAAIYLGRSKGLCSSYLFTVHNTEVYMYLSDRKVSFVNSDIFYVKFSYRKKSFWSTSVVSNWDIQSVISYLSLSKQCLQHVFRWSFVSKAILSCKKQCEFFPLLQTPSKFWIISLSS